MTDTGIKYHQGLTPDGSPSISSGSMKSNGSTAMMSSGGHGFSIPSSATILGIEVTLYGREMAAGSGTSAADTNIQLTTDFGSSGVGTNHSAGDTYPASGAGNNKTFGGPTDDWGASLTASQINNSGFGVYVNVIRTDSSGGITSTKLDTVGITVYYEIVLLGLKIVGYHRRLQGIV